MILMCFVIVRCRDRMEALIVLNNKLAAIGKSDAPDFVKTLQKLPIFERFAKNLLQLYFGKTLDGAGSYDLAPEDTQLAF